MTKRGNDRPAFPVPLGPQGMAPCDGMTMRDYFAAKAMQAMLTGETARGGATESEDAVLIAKASYLMADAMRKESDK